MGLEAKDIDYILVNKLHKNDSSEKEREEFENNLRKNGLIVEELDLTKNERFVQIKARKETLLKYCEIMKLRMPLKDCDNLAEQYSRNRNYLFDIDSENFITPATKYMIIDFILEQTSLENKSSDEDCKKNNTSNLIRNNEDCKKNDTSNLIRNNEDCKKNDTSNLIINNVYCAAYPLHDNDEIGALNDWGRFKFFPVPPLEGLKKYFGIKIALYFAWLHFYNWMLVIASVITFVYLIIGYVLSFSNKAQDEICKGNETFNMCPQCDKTCGIWNLNTICSYTGLVYILNNSITVFYTIIMALWSAVYLNMWNQYSTTLIQKWGIVKGEDLLSNEAPTKTCIRSAFCGKNCKTFPIVCLNFSVVLLWLCVVLAAFVGMIFYRISLETSEWLYGDNKKIYKSTVVEVTGAILDLISILVLNEVYSKVAIKLTEQEMHRTQKQYEESLMWKYYLFWFINYYSSFFYIAFFKGRFVGTPHKYNRIFGYRQEECGPTGCIEDLFIQMAVVMIGDMTYNNVIEYLVPYIKKKIRASSMVKDRDGDQSLMSKQWIEDYKLLYWGSTEISMEYLEMVLQYGLVILFVTAFPLGPILALLNNILEIKMDAKKLITNFRRPVAENVINIGVWLPILETIINLSVITNACIIAFTTSFIPDLIYRFYEINKKSYVDFNLSVMKISDLDPISVGDYNIFGNMTECRYIGYYNPPGHRKQYGSSILYWHNLAARLLFVLLFQYLVSILKMIIQSIIPAMPNKIRDKIIEEQKKTQRLIILEENNRIDIV